MLCLVGIVCLQVLQQFNLDLPLTSNQVSKWTVMPGEVFLAHNYKAGEYFSQLQHGSRILYDGHVYIVDEIVSMQAVEPEDPAGDLIDLETGNQVPAAEVVRRVYLEGMTLQTCIYRDGNLLWGRLFVRAQKIPLPHRGR